MPHPYLVRDIEEIVKKAVRQFPAMIITGPRQCGKTTLLKHLFSKTHGYVSLDEPQERLMANREPRLFLENYPPPVIIDEAQYAPGLFSYLKIAIDSRRSQKGQFLLTGSQSFPLMAKVTDSLAGRIAILNLLSFSFKERLRKKSALPLGTLKAMLLRGGFPELVVDKGINAQLWFSGYLQTYLERDLRQLRNITDLTDFQRFLELLAALNGQVLNLSQLSLDLGIAINTIKGWISVLEACHQIILVKPFYKNRGRRLIKRPKVYFLDTGFLCYLNAVMQKEQALRGPQAGQLFEGAVLGEIMRSFYNRGQMPRVFWWRTSHGEEVDFIIERKGQLIPIEVKMTSRIDGNLARGLAVFVRLFRDEIEKCVLVNLADKRVVLDKQIECLPFGEFIKFI